MKGMHDNDPLANLFAALIIFAAGLGLVYIIFRLAFALVGLFA